MRTGVNGSGDRRGADGTRTCAHSVHTALWLLAAFALATGCRASSAQTWDKVKVKEDLAARGITPSLVYDGNLLTDGAGGLKRNSILQGNLYLQIRIDSEKAFGFPGMKLFFSELVTHGPNPEDGLVGDAQGVNNVTSRPGYRSYEGWVQYNFFDNRWSVLVGQYDLATEFYTSQTANLFFNSAFGTGTDIALTGLEGPSIYPYTSLGGRIAYKPLNNVVFRTAILDGVPLYRPNDKISPFRGGDGLLIVSEAAWTRRDTPDHADEHPSHPQFRIGRFSGLPPYDDKVALGGWHYTAKFDALAEVDQDGNPLQKRDSSGAYLLVDKVLWEVHGEPKKQVAAFLQVGVARQQVDRFGSHYGAGLAAAGLIPGRPKDEIGVAVAIGRNGYSYMQSQLQQGIPVNRAETAIEATYLAQINDWLAIQPDVQYVVRPNTNPTIKDAFGFQLRAEIGF
jgi:porin